LIVLAVEAGAPPPEIQNSELARLHVRIPFQHFDDSCGFSSFLKFLKYELLVHAGVVDVGLTGGDALAGNHDRLKIHEAFGRSYQKVRLRHTCGGRDNDLPAFLVDGDYRPCSECRVLRAQDESKKKRTTSHNAPRIQRIVSLSYNDLVNRRLDRMTDHQ